VNDNPFSTLGLSLIASGNYAVSLATAVIAVAHLPVTMAVVAATFARRRLTRRRASRGGPGEPEGGGSRL
jgi:hypothetical protein